MLFKYLRKEKEEMKFIQRIITGLVILFNEHQVVAYAASSQIMVILLDVQKNIIDQSELLAGMQLR